MIFKYVSAGLVVGMIAMSASLWFAKAEIKSLVKDNALQSAEISILQSDISEFENVINRSNRQIETQGKLLETKRSQVQALLNKKPKSIFKIKTIRNHVTLNECDAGIDFLRDQAGTISWKE